MAAYTFDSFRIDLATRQLLKGDTPLALPAKVFDTLLFLVQKHPEAVSKEELIHAVWAGSFVSDDSLAQNISILRRTLGDDPVRPRYIATIARHGYRFIPSPSIAGAEVQPVTSRARWTVPAAWFVTGAIVATVMVLLVPRERATDVTGAFHFQEQLPRGEALSGDAAISPDGRWLAYALTSESGATRIWIRQLDTREARPLPGTEDGDTPFWSPDGRHMGFRTRSAVKRVDLRTGTVRVVAPLTVGQAVGASWGPGDRILYANLGKIRSVSASGSTPQVLVDVEAGELGEVRWPVVLPDGRHFLFFASGGRPERSGTYLGTVGSDEHTLLLPGFRATFAPPDNLVYVRDRALTVQRFDADRARLEGEAMTISGEVAPAARISASAGETLVITEDTSSAQLAWVDRRGNQVGSVGFMGSPRSVWLSPDDRHALALKDEGDVRELWLIDLTRNVSTRIRGNATAPAWAPDGVRFLLTGIGRTGSDLYLRTIAGSADEALWLKTDDIKVVNSWSPDGRFVVFTRYMRPEQTAQDLWLLPTVGERRPTPFVQTSARESAGQVSPDGRWIAYVSDETGSPEIYVQSFPIAGSKLRISTAGGVQPLWRRDRRELFYLSPDNQLMAVPLQAGSALEPGPPARLFDPDGTAASIVSFATASDGQRFLVVRRRPEGRVSILTNWQATRRP
jgi:DNA-binding winged helix-turn-helix (wHTH) protein/dipeptidyl aminopeptidase/acylaminoacyl peptidase